MQKTFRASMTWLHTWCGLLLGWLLYAIFITGTASYYRPEITRWMQPELRPYAGEPAELMTRALDEVRRNAPDATSIYIRFPNNRDPGLQLSWQVPGQPRVAKVVDAETAKIVARDSRGGEFFYRFHFQLQLPYPWGRYLASLAAAFMLVALFTGIMAHRQFFKDFFTFRPSKPGTRSWLDFHNLAGVVALPFYFVIAFTAQVVFVDMLTSWARAATEPPAVETVTAATPVAAPAGVSLEKSEIPPLPVEPMIKEYLARHGDLALGSLYATGLGTKRGNVAIMPWADREIPYKSRNPLNFSAATGVLVPGSAEAPGIVTKINDTLYGLHITRFAGPLLRALLFFLGLLGSALVATGLIMWTLKRRKRQESLYGVGRSSIGHWIVERLNITAIVGFPIALSAIFWANRLLPFDLAQRGDREVNVVFIVWGLSLVHACARPVWQAWREQLWLAAGLFTLLPFLDILTTEGFERRLGFNLVLVIMGALWTWCALRVTGAARRKRDQESRSDASSIGEAAV